VWGHGVLLVCTVSSVLYSEIAQSRKPFGREHMYIYTFLLRMADTMTSQNIYIFSCNTLCKLLCEAFSAVAGMPRHSTFLPNSALSYLKCISRIQIPIKDIYVSVFFHLIYPVHIYTVTLLTELFKKSQSSLSFIVAQKTLFGVLYTLWWSCF
jgi:hypothetical protein